MDIDDEGFKATVERAAAAERAFEAVTRLVVVKDNQRREYWADSWRVSIQDAPVARSSSSRLATTTMP
ncbi:hypothetical protein [Mycobacterium intracellulare]|uniref:Uncharacterized protein n=1 Tax=Mycobacterium intracellulare subsp. chimaera TaxID=222805 RepID=A0ABT7P2L3_MYCIT|nr:hypothetical protein [Mycobacterium intracellulare]MDM3927405.1 hypothetical protein [Mycobacterium intracellulare subsp. chimaera]